jgi:hypothetical protein
MCASRSGWWLLATLFATVPAILAAGCAGGGGPPFDELPLRDALRAEPDVVAALPDEARARLASRLQAEGARDTASDPVEAGALAPSALVAEVDLARQRRSADALVIGLVGGGAAQALPAGSQAAVAATLPPMEGLVATSTAGLEARALAGVAGASLRELMAASGATRLERVVGWPVAAAAIGETVYVNGAWLVAVSPTSADGGACDSGLCDGGRAGPGWIDAGGVVSSGNASGTGTGGAAGWAGSAMTGSPGGQGGHAGQVGRDGRGGQGGITGRGGAGGAAGRRGTGGGTGGWSVDPTPPTGQPPSTTTDPGTSAGDAAAAADGCAALADSCGSTDEGYGGDSCSGTNDGYGGDSCSGTNDGYGGDSCSGGGGDYGDASSCQTAPGRRGTRPGTIAWLFAPLLYLWGRKR